MMKRLNLAALGVLAMTALFSGAAMAKDANGAPDNCAKTGGGGDDPTYHCKDKDGNLKLCPLSNIKAGSPGCTALAAALSGGIVQIQPANIKAVIQPTAPVLAQPAAIKGAVLKR